MTHAPAVIAYLQSLGVELSPEKQERIAKILASPTHETRGGKRDTSFGGVKGNKPGRPRKPK